MTAAERTGRKPPRPLAKRALERFVEQLGAGWSVTHAAREVGVAKQRLYELRATDEGFALQWAIAYETGTQALEDEARRRAVDGVEEPVYQRGELVGGIRRYDTPLLMFLLRARRPDTYRDNVTVAVKQYPVIEAREEAMRNAVGGPTLAELETFLRGIGVDMDAAPHDFALARELAALPQLTAGVLPEEEAT